MLVCHQLGFKRKDRLAKEVRAPPEEEEVMIIEDVEQMSSENSCGESEGAQRPPSLGTQNDVNTVQNDVSVDADVGKQTGRATSTPLHTAPIHAVTDMGNSSSISSRSGVLGGLGEAFHQNQLGIQLNCWRGRPPPPSPCPPACPPPPDCCYLAARRSAHHA